MTCASKCETARKILELEDKISQLTEQLHLKDEEVLVAREELSQARTEISRLEGQIEVERDRYRDLLLSCMRTTLRELRSYIKRCLIRESVADQVGDLERRAWDVAVETAETIAPATSRVWNNDRGPEGQVPLDRNAVTGTVLPWGENRYAPQMAEAMIEAGVDGEKSEIIGICELIYQSLYTDNGDANHYGSEWFEEDRRDAELAAHQRLHALLMQQFGIIDSAIDSVPNTADEMVQWLKPNRAALIQPGDRIRYNSVIIDNSASQTLIDEFEDKFYMPDQETAREAIIAADRVLQCYDCEARPGGNSLGDRKMGSLKPELLRLDYYAKLCIDGMKQEEELRQSTNRRSLPCKSGPI